MIYGYIRVSTDTQDVDNQKHGITAKATQMGVVVDAWISDDGVSGTKEPEKRLLGKLLKKVKKGDMIISSEISRLGRSLFMVMRILEHCMKNEVKVITVKDGYELGDNITSKVLAFAFGLAAEIERDMISKRTKEALVIRKNKGMILGRPAGQRNNMRKCDALKNDIIRYNEKGVSMSKIAKMLKVHRLTISRFMQENNIIPVRGKETPTDKLIAVYDPAIRLYLERGLKPKDIVTILEENYDVRISKSRLVNYVSNDIDLHSIYKAKQDALRILANGSARLRQENPLYVPGSVVPVVSYH